MHSRTFALTVYYFLPDSCSEWGIIELRQQQCRCLLKRSLPLQYFVDVKIQAIQIDFIVINQLQNKNFFTHSWVTWYSVRKKHARKCMGKKQVPPYVTWASNYFQISPGCLLTTTRCCEEEERRRTKTHCRWLKKKILHMIFPQTHTTCRGKGRKKRWEEGSERARGERFMGIWIGFYVLCEV